MSVIRFSKEEIVQMVNGILEVDYPMYFGSSEADYYKIANYYNGDKDEYYKNKIMRFMQRVYIANQMAYMLQYRHHDSVSLEVDILEAEDIKYSFLGQLSQKDLIKELSSLSYNIYTNDGNYLLNKDDEELLERIINALKDMRIRNLEQRMDLKV